MLSFFFYLFLFLNIGIFPYCFLRHKFTDIQVYRQLQALKFVPNFQYLETFSFYTTFYYHYFKSTHFIFIVSHFFVIFFLLCFNQSTVDVQTWQKRGDTATLSQKGNGHLAENFHLEQLNVSERNTVF